MKNLSLLLLLFMLAAGAAAESLTPEQSLARLADSALQRRAKARSPHLVHTEQADGQPLFYVFDRPGNAGFLITSADDLVPALLGYAEEGTYAAGSMPPALEYWLADCAAAIQAAVARQRPLYASSRQPSADVIPPMLPTSWGQRATVDGSPVFNAYAPQADGKPCPIGCVATAMAQVMNYYRHPLRGKGEHEYWPSILKGESLRADFAATAYDWEHMQAHYGSYIDGEGQLAYTEATPQSMEAVNVLMYHCAVATGMEFKATGSGTDTYSALTALRQHFDYDPSAHIADRAFYGDADWTDILLQEMQARRPVIYTGQTAKGSGHTFVQDGYRDGLFHINWGWQGSGNGYYTLLGNEALHPDRNDPLGGTDYGAFSQRHQALVGIKPAGEGSRIYCYVLGLGNYDVTDKSDGSHTLHNGQEILLHSAEGFSNMSGVTLRVEVGLRLVDIYTRQSLDITDAATARELAAFGTLGDLTFTPQGVPDGIYEAYVIHRDADTDQWQRTMNTEGCLPPLVSFGEATLPQAHIDVALGRTADGRSYATLCYPLPLAVPEGITAYALTRVNTERHTLVAEPLGNVLPPHTPVVLESTEGLTAATFRQDCTATVFTPAPLYNLLNHTYKSAPARGDEYVLAIVDGEVGFHRYTGSVLPAFRAYYVPASSSETAPLSIDLTASPIATGLSTPRLEHDCPSDGAEASCPPAAYSLTGRRIASPTTRGLIIQGGRKRVRP